MANTNLHVTATQAKTMLDAVRFILNGHYYIGIPDASLELKRLRNVELMLVAALQRLEDADDRRNKKGVWA